jgi:hypothetical protein
MPTRRPWFVHDALYFQASDLTGILGGLALGIVEVRGYCDDRLDNLLTQIILGRLLHFLQDGCRNFLGVYSLPRIETRTSSAGPEMTLYETRAVSAGTSVKRRP